MNRWLSREMRASVSSPELLRDELGGVPPLCCLTCGAADVKAATLAGAFVYLRCGACAEVWAVPERRKLPRHALAASQLSNLV